MPMRSAAFVKRYTDAFVSIRIRHISLVLGILQQILSQNSVSLDRYSFRESESSLGYRTRKSPLLFFSLSLSHRYQFLLI